MATMLLICSAIILTLKMDHKMLVPSLQYVNVAHCNRMASYSDLEAGIVRRNVFTEFSCHIEIKGNDAAICLIYHFEELHFVEGVTN